MKRNSTTIRSLLLAAPLAAATLLYSCSGNKTGEEKSTVDTAVSSETSAAAEGEATPTPTEDFLQSLPSPTHVARIFTRSGLKYVANLGSSADKASSYQSANARALNLGIYSADLAYAVFNNQNQPALNYFKSVRTMSEGLQMSAMFENTNVIERVEKNLGNKDSLTYILSELSMDSDILLKNASRMDVIYLSMVGGYVESLYLATNLVTQNNNLEVYNRILDQQNSLTKLVTILKETQQKDEFKGSIDGLSDILNKLERVNANKAGVQSTDFTDLTNSVKTFRTSITTQV